MLTQFTEKAKCVWLLNWVFRQKFLSFFVFFPPRRLPRVSNRRKRDYITSNSEFFRAFSNLKMRAAGVLLPLFIFFLLFFLAEVFDEFEFFIPCSFGFVFSREDSPHRPQHCSSSPAF
jgi:hypothetical protein